MRTVKTTIVLHLENGVPSSYIVEDGEALIGGKCVPHNMPPLIPGPAMDVEVDEPDMNEGGDDVSGPLGTFEVGAVVRLKSGGPRMTVSSADESRVYCTWFNEEGKLTTQNPFPAKLLRRVFRGE